MQIAVTEQLKLLNITPETSGCFDALTSVYASACDEVSIYAFENDLMTNCSKLHDALYYGIRVCFSLKAQLTQSVFRTVVSRYSTLKTKLEGEHYKVKDDQSGKWYSFQKSLDWLEEPIRFLRPQADLVRGRDWNFLQDMTLVSVATLSGRVKVGFSCRKDCRIYDSSWKQGGAKLLKHSDGNWYLHVSLTRETETESYGVLPEVVGIDRGLVNIATVRDSKKTTYFNGEHIRKVKERFAGTRASLQKKGTKGAKRVLKRLSGRENRWMSNVNHSISKALTDKYSKNTMFVIEDLSGVSFDEANLSNRGADGRRELRSWSFYDLEQKLMYKASLKSQRVVKVDPHYTSQRCPSCGKIDPHSRNHERHEYKCIGCGAVYNDDEVSGYNLRVLGYRWLAGVENPCFSKQ